MDIFFYVYDFVAHRFRSFRSRVVYDVYLQEISANHITQNAYKYSVLIFERVWNGLNVIFV